MKSIFASSQVVNPITLNSYSQEAASLASGWGPKEARTMRRFLQRVFTRSHVLEVQIPTTGLSRHYITKLRKLLEDRVAYELPYMEHLHTAPVSIKALVGDEIKGSAVKESCIAVVVDLENFPESSARELTNKVRAISEVGELFSVNVVESLGIYQYRGLPCTVGTSEGAWAVSGVDYLEGGSGVLEWCYSEEDANERLKLMTKNNAERFKAVVEFCQFS